MSASHSKQHLFVIYFNFYVLANKDRVAWQKPAACKALLNVSFYYVGDDTDFWL